MPYTPPNGNLADVDFAADGGYAVPVGNDADVDFAGGGGIVFITGLTATVSSGTFVPVVAGVPAGQQATASVGAFVPHVTVALAGLQATISSETLGPSVDGNVSVNVDGLAVTASGGTLALTVTVALTGLQATATGGLITSGPSMGLAGLQATAQQQAIVPVVAVVLAGQEVTAAQGTLIGGSSGELTTQVVTAAVGTLIPTVEVVLSGLSATAAVGSFSPALTTALTGVQAAVSGGTTTPVLSVVPVGLAATISQNWGRIDVRYATPIVWTAGSYWALGRYNDATDSRNRVIYGTIIGPYLGYATYDTSQKGWRREGKWYVEFVDDTSNGGWYAGLGDYFRNTSNGYHLGKTPAGGSDLYGWSAGLLDTEFTTAHNGTEVTALTRNFVDGDVVMMAVDLDVGKIWFGLNGTWVGGGDPATGANPTYTGVQGGGTRGCIPMASLGTPGGATYHSIFIRAALDAMTYAIPSGFMPWETSELNNSKTLTGLAATVSGDGIQGFQGVGVLPSQTATIQQGTLTPSITNFGLLVGQQLTVTGRQFAAIRAGADVTIPITYPTLELSTSVGALGASLGSGATTGTRKTIVITSIDSGGSPAAASGGPGVSAFTFQNNLLPYNGVLKGGGEHVVNAYYVSPDTELSFAYHWDPVVRDWVSEPYFTSLSFDNYNQDPSYYDGNPYDFAPPTSYGAKTTVGRDGIAWAVATRAMGREANTTATPDVLHIVKREPVNGEGWYGGYIERLAVPSLDEADTLGIYAHDVNNFYIFYPATSGGSKVPAYRRYVGEGGLSPDLAVFESEVLLSTFTGNSTTTALAGSMCVTRSGYGDTIYITYESGTGHIGLIVMDAVTETVTSHVLTAVVTPNTTFIRTDEKHLAKIPTRSISEVALLSSGTSVSQFLISAAERFGGPWYSGSYPQTSTKPRVVHLSWTSGTATAPTMTLKAGPSDSTLAGGFESLEIRGDEVVHVLYSYDDQFIDSPDRWIFTYWTQANDATGTGNTWALDSAATWSWEMSFDIFTATTIPSCHYSGFGGGPGNPTALMLLPSGRFNYYTVGRQANAALNYWGDANILHSIPAYGRVGQVTISIVPGVVLSGQTATISQGTLVPSITKSIGAGLAATVSGGTIQGVIPVDATVGLTGLQATVSSGTFTVERGASLTGQALTTSVGTLASTGHQFASLTGQALVTSSGSVGQALAVTLAGAQLAVQQGLLTKEVAARLTGQSLTAETGVFVPALDLRLVGAHLQSGIGVFAPLTSVNLIGVQLSALDGSLQLALAVPLTGQSAAGQQGQLGFLYDCNVFPLGVQAVGEVGVDPTQTNVPPIGKDDLLWARAEVSKLFTQVSPDTLFNNVEPRE